MMLVSKLKVAGWAFVIGCGLFSATVFCVAQRSNAESQLQGSDESANDNSSRAQDFAATLFSESSKRDPAAIDPLTTAWETVVRIKIARDRSTGFGSGTIIHSTPDESIILTAAHLFILSNTEVPAVTRVEPAPLDSKAGGAVASAVDGRDPPSRFPLRISVDLFNARFGGMGPPQVRFRESVAGEVVDCDFARDVALLRIKPGHRLPSSPVVPRIWNAGHQKMLTIGCSEGRDPTTWYTNIDSMVYHFLAGKPESAAIVCDIAPGEGRTGGGLFTTDGYLAGVCNYSDPEGNRGYYAPPVSIYHLLSRNGLEQLYEPIAVADAHLDDEIRAAEEQLARDTVNLQRLKKLRGKIAADRAKGSDPPRSQAVAPLQTRPPSGPAADVPSAVLPDHERRLRELERKLERVLKSLDDPSAK